ncbi:helix-turn-helix domain-containing protein [Streptomyces sp. NPDC053367]|uniref:AraC-like ligand-binding domain-containing protein n=1 Tax=Streptomyces sp. NPDC053367 TaxID=3365700 RepID=UPI0037D23EC6
MDSVWTTDAVPAAQRVGYWRAALSEAVVPMRVTPRERGGPFRGRITAGRLGGVRTASIEADAHRAARTPTLISGSDEAYLTAAVQTSGTATLVQDGRHTVVGEGDLVVYDTARPYALDYPERFSSRQVQVPRRALALPEEKVRRVCGMVLDTMGGPGAVLRPFLTRLTASAHAYTPTEAGRIASGVVDLFTTLVASAGTATAAETSRAELVQRVRDHIDRCLGDPGLSPESVARAHHISVRYLHRLFEEEGTTVARLIRRRRLEECARELTVPGRPAATVSEVARRWGFANPGHFSRVFRGAYGFTPRQWRAMRDLGRGARG